MVQNSLDYFVLYSTEEESQSPQNKQKTPIISRTLSRHSFPFVEVLKASKEAEAKFKVLLTFKRA